MDAERPKILFARYVLGRGHDIRRRLIQLLDGGFDLAPVIGVTVSRCFSASARNSGSFMVASKAVRSAAIRSAGTSWER